MKQKVSLGLALLIGLVLMVMLYMGMRMEPVAPALADWPTPPGEAFGGGDWSMVPYLNAQRIATTSITCGSGQQTAAYVLADLQTVLDMNMSGQLISCTLEYSNDNTNWCGLAITVTSATTDSVSCDQYWLFGRYSRICCQGSSADVFTITQRAKVFN